MRLLWIIALSISLLAHARADDFGHRFSKFVKRNALKRQCPPRAPGGPAQVPLQPSAPGSVPSIPASASGGGVARPSSSGTPNGNSTTTPSTPGSATPFSGKAKRGLGFTKPKDTFLFPSAGSWGYGWNSASSGYRPGMVYLPMLWGAGGGKTGTWLADAQKGIDAGAPALLGFNEPDCKYGPCKQANLSPQEAAAAWRQWMHPFKEKALLISPAVTNGVQTPDAPMGLLWMEQFLAACSDCQVDGIGLHIYDRAGAVQHYKDYFTQAYEKLKRPLWLTEIGWSSGTDEEKVAFVKDFVPWAEQQDFIAAVAIFGAFPKDQADLTLIEPDGTKLSVLGEAYEAA